MSSLSLEESRARLKNHFAGEKVREASRWEELWNAGDFLPWDRHAPNPALTDILTDRADLIGPSVVPNQDGSMRRKRALVPGCGRGYDVLLLASFGYDAYGLEVSETAVQRCWQEQSENGSKYAVRDQTIGAGKVNFIQGDFFAIEWLAQVGGDGWIDLIYDYTFFSIFPPNSRPRWAIRMSQLLADDGSLICLEFPSAKDPKIGGPPYALPPQVYLAHLRNPGEEIRYDESTGHVVEDSDITQSAIALVRKAHWQPSRTHKAGEGTDWISVWQHQPRVMVAI